jgi:hypothetical protein
MAELAAHIDTASAELCAAAGGGHDGSEMAATRLRRDAPLC